MTAPATRQALLYECGFAAMAPEIDWTGSAVVFCQQLLAYLGREDGRGELKLLRELTESSALGIDRRMIFGELYAELLALAPEARHAALASNDRFLRLPGEFRTATARGITELGSKYLPNLYFHRGEIEDYFDDFLVSDSTCFLVVSNPGRGKTSLLCNVAHRLCDERNVLFLTARSLFNGAHGLLELISSLLGYGTEWQACFTDLARLRKPTLILLDAINESATPPEVLKEALHTLLREAHRANIKIVVTCRKDFWQFYRASWWANFIWRSAHADNAEDLRASARGQDLPLFTPEQFDDVVAAYFTMFNVNGSLHGEAQEQCRHPLMLRIFCEAYGGRMVGSVTELRRYRLFREFWTRKIGQVADISNLRQPDAVARLVLTVAGLMLQRQITSVPRETVAAALNFGPEDLGKSSSLYSRVLDEEIILEENIDEDAGIRNVVFVYDRFSEYAIALSLYTADAWQSKSAGQIVADVATLMRGERTFPTLRGALEFLVLRLEDRRPADGIQFTILDAMIANGWRWTSIGTVLAFQLDPALSGPAFWDFAWQLATSQSSFIRRIVADHIGPHADRSPEQVLPILNRLRTDDTSSVREAALNALRRLPIQIALREIELLSTAANPNAGTVSAEQVLAAQLLLWPRDSTSLALRRKLEWLIGPGRDVISERAVGRLLQADIGDLPSLDDLFGLEEVARAFDDLRRTLERPERGERRENPDPVQIRDAGVWCERAKDGCDNSVARLENDLAFLEKTLELATRLPGRIAIQKAGNEVHAAGLPHPNAGLRMYNYLTEADLKELQGITHKVLEQVAQTGKTNGTGFTTALSALKIGQSRGATFEFQRRVLEEHGLEASPADLRGLTTIGRLVLWIHGRLRRQRLYQSRLLSLHEEIKVLDLAALQDRVAVYQRPLPHTEQRAELRDLMLVLARVYRDRAAPLAELLAPLIVWHHNQDNEILESVMDEVHAQDADAFWRLTEALLTHSDPRIVDLASGAIERAEHAERQETADGGILSGLAEIVEEIAGVPADEVQIDTTFVDDLDIDSLSAVEIAVAAQEKFGIEIPDEQLPHLRTVRDVVEYIQEGLRRIR
jgi:acyl carrier protein